MTYYFFDGIPGTVVGDSPPAPGELVDFVPLFESPEWDDSFPVSGEDLVYAGESEYAIIGCPV